MTQGTCVDPNAPALDAHVRQLREQRGDRVSIDEIAEIVSSIMATISGDLTASDLRLYRELEGLTDYIRRARDEIAALYPEDIRDEHLPKASNELDAIVKATEEATGTILESAETIDALAAEFGADKIREQVIRIFEACSFQDITGQRIKKVVTTLSHIEARIMDLARVFGDEMRRRREHLDQHTVKKPKTDADLLNGPALAGQGNNQDEIDALLASFG
ncbi:MAG: protein phosphatase CheZ [Alphaproteobacteria bacterium]